MDTQIKVPFLDLAAQYKSLKTEIDQAIGEVLSKNQYILGPAVIAFENNFAQYCESQHCVGVGSGTDALHLALLAHGVGPGDEVITQANTFIATLEAISYTGAIPVLVDVDPENFLINSEQVKLAITPRTRAIVPVHLFGQPCDLDPIYAIAAESGLAVVEDASQAHGARYKGSRIGSRGTACFSFYPGKNLGAYGEGGAVVTSDPLLANHMRRLRAHGSSERYVHDEIGYNYRMDGIQGAVLGVKLPYLDGWNADRRRIAALYDSLLGDACPKPGRLSSAEGVFHIYPVFVADRARAQEELTKAGVETNVHYPVPCHLQKAYRSLGYNAGHFPVSEQLAREELSLPIYPEMPDELVKHVAKSLCRIVNERESA